MPSRVLTGHCPFYGPEGTDVLLHVHDDGTFEVALRQGKEQRWVTWGMPAELTEEKP